MTTQISENNIHIILILLIDLKQNYEKYGEKVSKYTNKRNIEELLAVIGERIHQNKAANHHCQNIHLNGQEAAEILRACWETNNLYRLYGDSHFRNLGVSASHFRATLNQIASVLNHIAEM